MYEPKIFALIIGTEILNRRRIDKHFDFISKILGSYGHKLSASMVIEDDAELIIKTLKFLSSQPNSIIFSFGGIGSTPDDYTRKCAAVALRDGELYTHPRAKAIIEGRLGKDAYPHPIKMAELPKGSDLIHNPVNKMPAFSLDERYFFMPGFPEMSHPMTREILKKLFPENNPYHRYTLTALCKENVLIGVMKQMPKTVEFSSLPKLYSDEWRVSISVASHDDDEAKEAFQLYINLLEEKMIPYSMIDESND